MDDSSTYERRIGTRVQMDPVEATWVVAAPARGRALPRRRQTIQERAGLLIEVSLTGAKITGPPGLRVRQRCVVRVEEAESLVEVRRVEPGPAPGTSTYGVEFLDATPQLAELICAVVARGRPAEDRWRHAR
jgi:hypothetical protein